MSVKERDPLTGHQTTGHEWNGITELNTPVPMVVWFFILVTHVWALAVWILLPTWPFFAGYTRGVLGLDQRSQVEARVADAALERGVDWSDAIAASTLDQIRVTPALMEVVDPPARRSSATTAPSATAGRRRRPGLPEPRRRRLALGRRHETVLETIRVGINSAHPDTRIGQMLAFGRDGILTRDQSPQRGRLREVAFGGPSEARPPRDRPRRRPAPASSPRTAPAATARTAAA